MFWLEVAIHLVPPKAGVFRALWGGQPKQRVHLPLYMSLVRMSTLITLPVPTIAVTQLQLAGQCDKIYKMT